jgi:putative molybdopterin biosynthesis protein
MPELLTPEEVAERLRVAKQTVYAWLKSGQLKGVKVGNLWRITTEALEEFSGLRWEETQRITPS